MMTNPARKQTDKLLEELEKKFETEYKQAFSEMKDRADKYFAVFNADDAAKRKAVQAGQITQKEYQEWRAKEMMTGGRYRDMLDTLAKDMVKTDQLAMKALDTTMKDTLAINANYAAYEVEKATGINTSWTLYNRDTVGRLIKDEPDLLPKPKVKIAEDMKWNRQHISSALAQGILQGDSIDKITDRLMSVSDMDSRAAIRNARTMVTSAENAGKEITYSRAEQLGIKGKKMWMATKDKRTRESHALLDGETVDLDEPFSNGLMYPGDPDGDPEEVYNCRCTMVYVSEHSAFRDDYETYEEWLGEKEEKKSENSQPISESAQAVLDKVGKWNVAYLDVKQMDSVPADDEIISKLAGGDKTRGSCASLSLAYAGNKCGFDVTDFRGGESRAFFAQSGNLRDIMQIDGVKSTVIKASNDIKAATDLLKSMEDNKEYILVTGKHAAIVKRTEEGYQYLEMQSAKSNGWKAFNNDTLKSRFGCKKSHSTAGWKYEVTNILAEVDSFADAGGYREILGYLNTDSAAQMKGAGGFAK